MGPKDGLVADMRVRTVMCSRRTKWRPALTCAAFLSILLIVCSFVLGDRPEDTESVEVPDAVAHPNSYEFTVYALNQTARMPIPSGTFFQFDEGGLPFSISSVRFGDFREDCSYQSIYYGCSGLLMNASGEEAAVTIYEGSGKQIADILYHGQDPVVIGSEVRYDSYSDVIAWTGIDLIMLDWINGSWTPRQGIYVEHTAGVIFASAKLFVMVFEPSTSLDVPEYRLPVVALVLAVLVIVVRRERPTGGG